MPGVEVTAARRNHLISKVPTASLALTSSDVLGSEIETKEAGDIQPPGPQGGTVAVFSADRPLRSMALTVSPS